MVMKADYTLQLAISLRASGIFLFSPQINLLFYIFLFYFILKENTGFVQGSVPDSSSWSSYTIPWFLAS